MSIRTGRATSALAATTGVTLVLALAGGGVAHAAPGHPGTPDAPVVAFHEDFEAAPDSGPRTMLGKYQTADGKHYTADPYWMSAPMANGLVLSWNNTKMPVDGTAAENNTDETAFKVLRQLSEAIGKINGTANPRTNTAISAYTQSTGKPPAGGKVMFQTLEDIQLKDANGRFLAFQMSAAATSAASSKPGVGRVDPQLMFYVAQGADQTALTTTPINPITDPRARQVAVSPLDGGAKEAVFAGQYASDKSFLYDGGKFGIVIRNMTSAHMGNDGAFDDIKVLDVTPQLDKQFGQAEATIGQSVRLTFTVTNTDELAQKTGWSFTDALPAGLVVAADPDIAVSGAPTGAATVKADPGATSISVSNGDLKAGATALTISLNVTADKAGTYTNGSANIAVHRGLDSPDSTTVQFKAPLTVHHVDVDGKPLIDPTSSTGFLGEAYTTSPATIEGYELISTPANANGAYATGPTVVTYVYAPVPLADEADLTVLYVDQQGNALADPDFEVMDIGAEYTTGPKPIGGWTLTETPANATGTIAPGHNVVRYVYTKDQPAPAPADLVVRWVDEHGNDLADPTAHTGVVGEPYATDAKTIGGYALKTTPTNASGTLVDGTTTVVYVYSKVVVPPAKADLTVRWVDENGTPLADETHRDGTVGEKYTTQARTFDGYELVAVPGNASGSMAEGTVVTYVYKPLPAPGKADLTVRFVDEQGNPLADPTHRDGEPGEHYSTTPATIPGYELVAVPANASGEMAEGTEVVYVYRKVTPPVVPAPTDPYVSEVLAADVPVRTAAGGLASTGSDALAIGALAAALAGLGGLLVAARPRAARQD